jgi:predicted dienelactone hydrolase
MSSRMSNAFLGITLAVWLMMPDLSAANTNSASDWGHFEVGFTEIDLMLKGSSKEDRPLHLMVWYPADVSDYRSGSPAYYRPRLYGVALDPARWDPLSWQIQAERARNGVAVDATGPSFPLLIFSPANAGDPHNYAFTSERLASHGYVVVGPFHNGDNQDDRRIDFINLQAGFRLLQCLDNQAPPCIDAMARSMTNRHLDLGKIIDSIGDYFGERVDVSRVGVMGQSRGSMTALAAVGGSALWSITPDPRISGVMTLATGSTPNMGSVNMEATTVPTLMVVGSKDGLNHFSIAQASFARIPESTPKALVIIEGAHHRVYGDTYCAQAQIAAAIAQSNPRAILEVDTLSNLYKLSPASGSPLDWCPYDTFVNPVDVTAYTSAYAGKPVTPSTVPSSLESVEVMRLTTELAVTFFDTVLDKNTNDGMHFTRYLAAKFLLHHEGDIRSAEAFAGSEEVCPEGQDINCAQD